ESPIPWPVAWIGDGTFRAVHPDGTTFTGRVSGASVAITKTRECAVVGTQTWQLESPARTRGACVECEPVCPAGGDAIDGAWVPEGGDPESALVLTNRGEHIEILR